MSITDLNPLELSWLIGARKLPAAPALERMRKCHPPADYFVIF